MYFAFSENLYYVIDTAESGNMLLIEDCKTEDLNWFSADFMKNASIRVVNKC